MKSNNTLQLTFGLLPIFAAAQTVIALNVLVPVPGCGFFKFFGGFLAYLCRLYLPFGRSLACASNCSGSWVRPGPASISLVLLLNSRFHASARLGSPGPGMRTTARFRRQWRRR